MKIAVLDVKSIGQGGLDYEPLNLLGDVEYYDYTDTDDVIKRLTDIDVAVSNKIAYDEEVLSQLPKLKLICMTGTGYNHIDTVSARKHNVGVCNVVDYCTDSVAQHTFAMVLNLLNNINYYKDYVTSGSYIEDESFKHYEVSYRELASMKWGGIIGLGHIGHRVADIASAFGATVVYYSTSGQNDNSHYKSVSLEALIESSDIITIHAPLNERTKNLITYKSFEKMKARAVVVNVGRGGGILNEEDVAKVIEKNLIGGIGLDVLSCEPMSKESPLIRVLDKNNLLITPHVAWASIEARQRVVSEVVKNIEAFYKKENMHRVDLL